MCGPEVRSPPTYKARASKTSLDLSPLEGQGVFHRAGQLRLRLDRTVHEHNRHPSLMSPTLHRGCHQQFTGGQPGGDKRGRARSPSLVAIFLCQLPQPWTWCLPQCMACPVIPSCCRAEKLPGDVLVPFFLVISHPLLKRKKTQYRPLLVLAD